MSSKYTKQEIRDNSIPGEEHEEETSSTSNDQEEQSQEDTNSIEEEPSDGPTMNEIMNKRGILLASLSSDTKREIREIFTVFDTDGSASIDPDELRVVMKALGFFFTPEEVAGLVYDNLGPMESLGVEDFMHLMAVCMVSL